MRPTRMALLVFGLAALSFATKVEASHPSYLVLQAPTAHHSHHMNQGSYPGYGYVVEPRGYSYGWFGAKPAKQWTRHFGYYRNYTEWSAR